MQHIMSALILGCLFFNQISESKLFFPTVGIYTISLTQRIYKKDSGIARLNNWICGKYFFNMWES